MDLAQALREPHELGSVQEIEDVLQNTDNVLLLIYMPGCGHCTRYFPTHRALAKLLHAGNTGVAVAQIDGSTQEEDGKFRRDLINERAGGELVKGFPTILLKRANGDLLLYGQGDDTFTSDQFQRTYPGAHPQQQDDQSLTVREYGETQIVPVVEEAGRVRNIFEQDEQSRDNNSILTTLARFMNKPGLYPIEADLPERTSKQSTHVLHYVPPLSGSVVPGALQGLVRDPDFPNNADAEELTAVIIGRLMANPELAAKVLAHPDPQATEPYVRTSTAGDAEVQVVTGPAILHWLTA